MQVTIDVEATHIVLAGQFNPAIFSPHWLAATGIIDRDEADRAQISIIHPDLASFQTDWFQIYVEQEKCTIVSINAVSIRVFDLAMKLFGDFLPHTPIRAMGINYVAHFRVKNIEVLNRIGDTLAPKAPWGEWGSRLNLPAPKEHHLFKTGANTRSGGLRSILMTQYVRPDNVHGYIGAKIEPSLLYPPGIYIEVNDHYELQKDHVPTGSSEILKLVDGKFDESASQAKALVQHFMKMSEEYSYERD